MDGGTWDARGALRSADWKALTPKLVACARWRYVVATKRVPTATEVQELIQEAVVRVLDGRRKWHRADPPELFRFLAGVMRSIVNEFVKKKVREARRHHDVDVDQIEIDPVQEVHDSMADLVEEAIGDDTDLQSLYLGVVEGSGKREDTAACLGWDVERVSVQTKKLKRRVIQLAKINAATASKDEERRS